MKCTNKVRKLLSVGSVIFILLILVSGSTFAYLRWESSDASKTMVTFTTEETFSCSADGGGNITSQDVLLVPTSCENSDYVIKREIKVMPTIIKDNPVVSMDLFLDVNLLDSGLSNSKNFSYALTTSSTSCTDGVVSSGNFNGKTVGNKIKIFTSNYVQTSVDTYYLYVWLDKEETSQLTMNQNFNLSLSGICEERNTLPPNAPVLNSGMIPVTIADDGTVTTVSSLDSSWYNYEDKKWANIVLVKDNGTNTRSYYENNYGVIIPESDILAYYVWIPRYKYKIWTTSMGSSPQTIDIQFETADAVVSSGTTIGSWKTAPGFIWDGDTLPGIWVGKFEMSHSSLFSNTTDNNLGCTDVNCTNADGLLIKPNVISLRYNDISNQFYATRSMSRIGNPFGLNLLSTDSHMMKNSEWGALAYLSYSVYGKNEYIYKNSNSQYTTGCGAFDEIGSSTSSCTSAFGNVGSYPQSTTGNITGVFDIAGGSFEYVMANYGNVIDGAGFVSLPALKYYDLYPSNQFTLDYTTNMSFCTLDTCGGHALHEMKGWYNGSGYFIDGEFSWLIRGGQYNSGSSSGFEYTDRGSGNVVAGRSFRSVLVPSLINYEPATISVSSTNDVATSQTVTLSLSDGSTEYYWGTSNPETTSVSWESTDSSKTITKSVSSEGTYYAAVKDIYDGIDVETTTFYRTTLDLAGATGIPEYVITKSGNSFTLPTVNTDADSKFNGWYSAEDGNGVKYETEILPTGNSTLYAHITSSVVYTIKYHLGNGSSTAGTTEFSAVTSCNYNKNCVLKTFGDLGGNFPSTVYGWTFAGWSTSSSGTSVQYTDGQTVKNLSTTNGAVINLYAVGKRDVNFYSGTDGAQVGSTQVQYWNPYSNLSFYTTLVSVPDAEEINGWTFVGYSSAGVNIKTNCEVNGSLNGTQLAPTGFKTNSLRAVYKRTLTIVYNANGGTGTTASSTAVQYFDSGVSGSGVNVTKPTFTLAANGFSRTGYEFDVWAGNSAGSGGNYGENSSYSGWTFAVDALPTKTLYAKWKTITYTISFDANGGSGVYNDVKTYRTPGEHVYTVPSTGTYKLEVWGAQGGTSIGNDALSTAGGYGGYSVGQISLSAGTKLYVNVGGKGSAGVFWASAPGGYNGGGSGTYDGADNEAAGGGGGATHIATASGVLSSLSSNVSSILIVAGGGGGTAWTYAPGHGGGINGGTTSQTSSSYPTQSAGNAFGQGQNASGTGDSDGVGGGGGGYYGGYANNVAGKSSGTGGSGYIGNSSLTNKAMYCYNCTTSSTASTLTYSTTNVSSLLYSNYAKSGDGAARIIGPTKNSINVAYNNQYGTLPVAYWFGKTFAGWNTKADGTGTTITSSSVVTSNVTLYAQWTDTVSGQVHIRYNTNGGDVVSSGYSNDEDGSVRLNGNFLEKRINYGATLGSTGLDDWNATGYLIIDNNTRKAGWGAEWKCLSGCSNKFFNQNFIYPSSDFCDASEGDCTVVLGVNWSNTINETRFSCEANDAMAKYNFTSCNGDICSFNSKNYLTSSFGSWTSSASGDIKGTPTWSKDLTKVTLYTSISSLSDIASEGYTCKRYSLYVNATSGLNCRYGPTTETSVVKAFGNKTNLLMWPSTMKYSTSYKWYYSPAYDCYLAGQYVSTTVDTSGGSSTGSGSGSTCTKITGTCTCKYTSSTCTSGNCTIGASCSGNGLKNYSACSSYCSSKYAGISSSTCKTTC